MTTGRKSASAASQPAFTLIELLATVVIIAIVLGLCTQLLNTAQVALGWSEKRLSADGEGRRLLGLMERDFRAMILHPQAELDFRANQGNDSLAFLAMRPGFDAAGVVTNRQASWTEYGKIGSAGQLGRGSTGFDFTGTETLPWGRKPTAVPNPQMLAFSKAIVRWEFECLILDGSQLIRSQQLPADRNKLLGWVVTIAATDENSLRPLGADAIRRIADVLPDASSSEDTAAVWQQRLRQDGAGDKRLAQVLSSLRIYQQTLLTSADDF
jgi:prepilin-type N-terminal cleavage/methylation domain-containing protein